jgi:hypothetical protein
VQHLKLGAILDIVKLTLPMTAAATTRRGALTRGRSRACFRERTRSWASPTSGAGSVSRPGPARRRADEEFAFWRAGTVRVIETLLSSGRLALDGADFVRHMAGAARDWAGEPVPAEARSGASRKALRHLPQWEASNGPAPA